MATKPTKFVDEPPALICPVCQKIFCEPVISVKCGHTFCRGCIEEVIKNGLTCPLDQQECDSSHLVLNRAVIGQIDDLQVHCCHGIHSLDGGKTYELDPSGCKEVLRFSARDEHERTCQFEVVGGPNLFPLPPPSLSLCLAGHAQWGSEFIVMAAGAVPGGWGAVWCAEETPAGEAHAGMYQSPLPLHRLW